jgi:hypothetical protein
MTRAVWCPFATQDVLRSGAGAFVNATAKIVHHTTEGSSYAGARAAYEQTGALPHFTDSFENGAYRVWQHLPIDQAATALKHPSGTPETNRANAVQIEHVGFAGRAHDFSDGYLLGIATLCRWVESERGVPRSAFEADGSPSNVFFGNLLDHPEYGAGAGRPNGPAVNIEFWPQGQGGEGYVIYCDDRAEDQRVRPYHFDAGTRK